MTTNAFDSESEQSGENEEDGANDGEEEEEPDCPDQEGQQDVEIRGGPGVNMSLHQQQAGDALFLKDGVVFVGRNKKHGV